MNITLGSLLWFFSGLFVGFLLTLLLYLRRKYIKNDELEEKNSRLTTDDAKKNEFLSFATHQLRTPLTAIKWGLDSLASKYDQQTIIHLEKTTDDLIDTVNDLLDISKIDQGGLVLKKDEFDFLDCVGRIVEEFRPTAEQKGVKLLFEYEHHQYLIHADQNKLRQVVVNLIDNAIKYTKEGSVTVSLTHPPQEIALSVVDTGAGMSHQELSELFEKFLRGAAGKASQTGSGLGLFLAKKIVSLHGGNLTASSLGVGKGSTFRVELPTKR